MIIFAFLYINKSYGQEMYLLPKTEYKIAFEYIRKTMPVNSSICVSNHIIDLGIYVVNELDSFPDLRGKLQNLDDKKVVEKGYEAFYNKDLDNLFCKPMKAKAIIFFSKIEDEILRADLVICDRIVTKSIDFDSAIHLGMGSTFSYVFFFAQNGTLKKSFSYEMLYEAIGPVFSF